MVSYEHSMLVYKGYKTKGYVKEVMQPEDLMEQKRGKGYYNFLASFKHDGDGLGMTDNQIRIDMMIADDARIRKSHVDGINNVHLHFNKIRKIERAIELITNEGIDFTKNVSEIDGSTNIYFKISNTYDKTLIKYYKANRSQLKVLSEESLLWDGHKGYRSYYSNTNKDNIDVIQFAFSSSGIRAGISMQSPTNDNWNYTYYVTPTKNPHVGYDCDVEMVKSVDGKKYCFMTDTGFFVARRNGKIFITGNCGMRTIMLGQIDLDLEKLDIQLRKLIPTGFNVHNKQRDFPLETLRCFNELKSPSRIRKSVGTLGGGNHFIEVDMDEIGNKYLIIHTGSRNLGHQVAELYQKKAIEYIAGTDDLNKKKRELIEYLTGLGRASEIEESLKDLTEQYKTMKPGIPEALCYLEGEQADDYLHDMRICQKFAERNRETIGNIICEAMDILPIYYFETVHNYISSDNIVRKGAISAQKGEPVLIPLNMKDGCILGVGLGNEDWNCSAPHGAGRMMSRIQAKKTLSMEEFKESMGGIYSSSVTKNTLDEAPLAYKPPQEIIDRISDTVEISKILKPIYNFKDISK